MKVVYDSGVLVAADRNDRAMWAEHRIRLEVGILPVATAPVVAQVSRSGQQAQLRRFLRGCQIADFNAVDGHVVGGLLAAAELSDVVDAHVVLTAAGGVVVTSDPKDISRLAAYAVESINIQTI